MGTYIRLIDFTSQQDKENAFLNAVNDNNSKIKFTPKSENFGKIPGSPVAYWVSERWFGIFDVYPSMRDRYVMKKGTSTGDNAKFIKNWFEISFVKIAFDMKSPSEASLSRKKWFPINGGGERRKWYGNRTDVVNWENDGAEMKTLATKLNHGGHWSRYIINPDRFFTEAIGWSAISTSKISARYIGNGFAFSSAAMEMFGCDLKYNLALINSTVAEDILPLLAPTINFGVEQIGKIPVIINQKELVNDMVSNCISLSQSDWDSFETSWDFKKHPLI